MVGDGANDPKTTRPFRPGNASDTLAAARPTRWAGVTRTPVALRTCSMKSSIGPASTSRVAAIIGSFR
jgi:hypothetical protein